MNRSEVIAAAAEAVNVSRRAAYGDLTQNFKLIANLWSCYLGVVIAPADVAALMALFKVSRIRANASHADSWVDLAGYAACGAEVAPVAEPVKPE